MNTSTCPPWAPCRRWRTCARCARIRQAHIATLAETRAAGPYITWACLDYDAAAKTAILRSRAFAGTGGLWTIEHGTKPGGRGLHVNLLIDRPDGPPPDAADIARAAPKHNVWAEPIARADVRNVAAYISKRSQYPDPALYAGRLMGTWGHWRGPVDILATDTDAPPLAQAAALQTTLQASGAIETPPAHDLPAPTRRPRVVYSGLPTAPEPTLTKDQYRDIAAKHLGPLLEMMGRKL